MRIYAVADIHNQEKKIASIQKTIERSNPDVLVVAGDITSYFKKNVVIKKLNELSVPVFLVRGNSDFRKVDKHIDNKRNISSLHLNKVELKGYNFIGLSGTIPFPFYSRICLNESKIFGELTPLLNHKSIMVAHAPPRGTLDRVMGRFHAGCYELNRLLFEVNCSMSKKKQGALIEIHNDCILNIEML